MYLVGNDIAEEKRKKKEAAPVCYHCGTVCITSRIRIEDKFFCCQGCKLVYELLNEKGLCDYYTLGAHPGLGQIKPVRNDKFAYLDDYSIAERLCNFRSKSYCVVTFYIPSIHCSSCMWLLEHLDRIDPAVTESRINFSAKELTVHFSPARTSLRKIVELLATIGYEPYISLDDVGEKKVAAGNKQRITKLGIAGFCFGNIMMMSLPEYFAGEMDLGHGLNNLFRYLDLLLSLPVFFYSATEFYSAAWAGLKQKILNIDAPIVLALFITFGRSVYEILSGTGAGYLDSMSGIVFFMLVGRVIQERTYRSLTFTRDYKAYFPIAISVQTQGGVVKKQLKDLRKDDVVILHHEEIVPADSVVLGEGGKIDYSFVTGEAEPVFVGKDELIYAGGKLQGQELIIKVVKPITASYLTSLWNHRAFNKDKAESNDKMSVVHVLSRYFTLILFTLAIITAVYWAMHDASKIVTSVSAMLIVACPCALLLAATFTNSNTLRIFSLNGFYLRDASVVEPLTNIDTIVFDKTGTITTNTDVRVSTSGDTLSDAELDLLYTAVSPSLHPNSVAIKKWLGSRVVAELDEWEEIPGEGVQAVMGKDVLRIGNAHFVGVAAAEHNKNKAASYVSVNGKTIAFYFEPALRPGIKDAIAKLSKRFRLSVLSGDHDKQRGMMQAVFGRNDALLFEQKPLDKLRYIEGLQKKGDTVAMIGDGLNDAGALQQSNVGIALADNINNFTPACDVILDAEKVSALPELLSMARWSAAIIKLSFFISVIYNVIGLYHAMSGSMRPVVAAILMPCSTLSIVIISSGLSNLVAWKKQLNIRSL
ncbi:heavy metal translocating P-type ATPase metal-binding domain-containing protein [Nemorincola caseinilytica]|uniref:Heavy metal translocating P-type ATPase metal-binding domain-containing protein n=1 Tax=Nemorincola caseinilytica TaxID=2054315 RepID=A0ABP8NIR6_9BACT